MKNAIITPEGKLKTEFSVQNQNIDQNGHVNNVIYVQWMQDIAVQHSRLSGGTNVMLKAECTWMVRTHHVEYLNQAFAGDIIIANTWVENFRRVRSLRKYEFIRKSDKKLLVKGETEWVFINIKTGHPSSIPETVKKCFPLP